MKYKNCAVEDSNRIIKSKSPAHLKPEVQIAFHWALGKPEYSTQPSKWAS